MQMSVYRTQEMKLRRGSLSMSGESIAWKEEEEEEEEEPFELKKKYL